MGKKTNEPIVWHKANKGMYLECPYRSDFTEEMKLAVPNKERRWDKERMQWWISDLYIDEVDNLLNSHFERYGSGRRD
jgi:hypothetical protein